ncbi:leucine rich repeat kinase 2 [Phyllostomus discolor]|uniref:Leucine rich repeat kinase 2 n=1 Tax=Phyllostomus discolor TaxID=89673 RepID=A0A834EKF2_9CHIR|nr:leucine rich repeat kinase 2 [Phyllostomus discolor]
MSSSIMEQKDQQLLNLCCKCFAKLAMDEELKCVMLERACDQNNSIMAECLLLLGADANRAKEGASLICQVNFQGDTFAFTLLTLLLCSYYLHPVFPHCRIYQYIAQVLVLCSTS